MLLQPQAQCTTSCTKLRFKYIFIDASFCCSYEATVNRDPIKDEVKHKFSTTLQFVEEYLSNVVNRSWSFADKEQNKLTYEVSRTCLSVTFMDVIVVIYL